MQKSILFLSCMFSLSFINAGICIDTLVNTPDGQKEIKVLAVGDKLYAFNSNNPEEVAAIATIQEIEVDTVVEITTADNITITVAADQKLFVTHKWVQANQLTLEDVLLTKNRTFVGITSIKHVNALTKLRYITLDSNPTFFAAPNGVLVHNGPVGATVGSGIGFCAVQGAYWGVTGCLIKAVGVLSGPLAPGTVPAFTKAWYSVTWAPVMVTTKAAMITGGVILGTVTGPV